MQLGFGKITTPLRLIMYRALHLISSRVLAFMGGLTER